MKPDGSTFRSGERLVQADYARTLRAILEGGHDVFYRGPIAERMAADLAANGSAVKLQALGIASRELRSSLGTDTASIRATSKEWAARVADSIRAPAGSRSGRGSGAPAALGVSASRSRGSGLAVPPPQGPRGDDRGHTTHLTVADSSGMVVALTQTLGPTMGSKVVTPGLGFLYASTLGGYLGRMEPGERAASFISPFMVLKDGQPFLALGAAGGARIVSGVVEVVSRVIDAETSPGIGWTAQPLADMRALGITVKENPDAGEFSRVHAIHYDAATRTWFGAADPDWEGTARGPVRPPAARGGN